ncbi:MAG TPA: hypothetical protein VF121_02830 [Thermoanaerobaculia bacterium]|nr:hypothetical protein [Thermoanaerobaculia bacterium]
MPSSEYDPFVAWSPAADEDDLEAVRERFRGAGRPYLSSPWPWLAWAIALPAAALSTPAALGRGGGAAVLLLWSAAILLAGAVEVGGHLRARRLGRGGTPLAGWALSVQGNLSLVALALSALLVWQDLAWALPALWLLLLGHSLWLLGGLAFEPFRACGLLYQAAGLLALWPALPPLAVLAAATFAGNLWIASALWREGRPARGR